jgi:hypothetical protein
MCLLIGIFLLAGCAGGGGHPSGPILPLSAIGMNLTITDLVNRPDAGLRAATYLDEIAAAGYAHEIRMPLDRYWGPQLLTSVVPVIRAKGFKLLAILTPGNHVAPGYDAALDLAWIEHVLPQVRDILVGVQLANEQWQTRIDGNKLTPFPPAEYVYWHRWITPTIRRLAPGVPIVEGDIDGGWKESIQWWDDTQRAGTIDSDALSWHVYGADLPPAYGRIVWITEAGSVKECVAPAVKCYPYTWNSTDRFAKRPGRGILP